MVRNGLRGRTQRYKSKDCGRRFDGGIRRVKSQVITDYVEGKQTLEQLAIKYGVNEKTTRRDLEGMRYVYKIAKYKESFVGAFEEWYEKYKDIVNERVQDKRIKHKTPPYMRPRLRSAYRSVRRNMPLLWTFYDWGKIPYRIRCHLIDTQEFACQ